MVPVFRLLAFAQVFKGVFVLYTPRGPAVPTAGQEPENEKCHHGREAESEGKVHQFSGVITPWIPWMTTMEKSRGIAAAQPQQGPRLVVIGNTQTEYLFTTLNQVVVDHIITN